jgi:uncharacterized membrane protein YfcA
MASGGSFISFPAILGVGVLPVQANATNTVAQWPGQAVSALTLRADLDKRLVPAAAFAALLGGAIGAELLLHTAQSSFLEIVPWLILVGTVAFAASPYVSKWLRRRSNEKVDVSARRSVRRRAAFVGLLPVAVYLGYFGAGAGFMVLTVMALLGVEEIYELNAIKTFVVTLSNFVATALFIASGAVARRTCLIALTCAIPGGYLGARLGRRINPVLLRALVIAVGCSVATYFFWQSYL